MRILIIEPCHINFSGYQRSFPIGLALSKKNIRVDLLVSSRDDFKLGIKKTRINENYSQYELPRINIHPYVNGRILRGILAIIAGIFGKYNIIFARVPTQLESNIPAFFLKLLGKKVVLDWDDYWMGSPIFTGHNLLKKYIRFCEMKAPKFFGQMVVISDFLGQLAKERGARKIFKLINGTMDNQFQKKDKSESLGRLKLNKDAKYLLSIGNTYSRERTELLFAALKQIRKLDPAVKLLCNFNLEKKIKEQNLEGKIDPDCLQNTIALGYLSQSQLEDCFSVASAALFLQGDTADERACYPVRVASYLSAGLVIIIIDTDSEAAKTLKKYNCAIIEKDLATLAQKTAAFLSDDRLQEELHRKIILAKKDLYWDNLAIELIKFFQKIIQVR